MQPAQMYDRAITVFSPDGRLFQVEYAREAVKRGTTTVGVKFQDGVVLIVDKRINSDLIDPDSIEKIFKIDRHLGCATSGLVADARVLVDRARLDSQLNRLSYGEDIDIETLVKRTCDFKQTYTQYGGVRPFGTALLIAGVDAEGAHLYETDPSGALMAYKASAIGAARSDVMNYFEEHFEDGMSKDEALQLGLTGLDRATEGSLKPEAIEIGLVSGDNEFGKLSRADVEAAVQAATSD